MAITWSQVPGSPSGTSNSPATCASTSSAYAIVLLVVGSADRDPQTRGPRASPKTHRGPAEFQPGRPPGTDRELRSAPHFPGAHLVGADAPAQPAEAVGIEAMRPAGTP